LKLLTIDTSSSSCGVSLTDGERLLGEYLLTGGKGVSSRLFDAIERLMTDCGVAMNELDGFGVSQGPGAFTGLRVGIGAVKGLAIATGKPVAGFSSLAMLAMNLPLVDLPVCTLYDARRNEVYAGLYSCSRSLPESLRPDAVIPPEALTEWITGPTILVGDGAVRYRNQLVELLGDHAIFAPPITNIPRASNGAMIACFALQSGNSGSAADLLPVYLRLSEAEIGRKLNTQMPI
jgi:tRNA threonylcarbamoyladenosine biosynthesis protein TsaB